MTILFEMISKCLVFDCSVKWIVRILQIAYHISTNQFQVYSVDTCIKMEHVCVFQKKSTSVSAQFNKKLYCMCAGAPFILNYPFFLTPFIIINRFNIIDITKSKCNYQQIIKTNAIFVFVRPVLCNEHECVRCDVQVTRTWPINARWSTISFRYRNCNEFLIY